MLGHTTMQVEQFEHTHGHATVSRAAAGKTLSKRVYPDTNADADRTITTRRSRKRHRIAPPPDNTDDISAGLHARESTHGSAERAYDVAQMNGARWLRVRAKLEHEQGERESYGHLMVIRAIVAVNEDEGEDGRNEMGNERAAEGARASQPLQSRDGVENSERSTTNADISLPDIEARQIILTRIEDKWGMPPVDVIPDGMRAHFNHPMDPLKWSISALRGLYQIADACPPSTNFNTLRGVLYDAYTHRTKSLVETKELSVKDVGYVLDWMKGKQHGALTNDDEAAARDRADRTVERLALPDAPALPSVGNEVGTPMQPQQHRKLAEAESNLSASLSRRRVLEANVTVAIHQREVETLRPHRQERETIIIKAELAVSEARVEVESARLVLIELRRKEIYGQAGIESENATEIE
jgi:hypothetical protein